MLKGRPVVYGFLSGVRCFQSFSVVLRCLCSVFWVRLMHMSLAAECCNAGGLKVGGANTSISIQTILGFPSIAGYHPFGDPIPFTGYLVWASVPEV